MKFRAKLLIPALIGALTMTTFTGCLVEKVNKGNPNDTVVAVVNGENILKGQVMDLYNSEKSNYGITDQNENTADEKDTVTNLKSSILDSLVYEAVINQKAKAAGYNVTNDDVTQAKKQFDDMITSLSEQMKSQDSSTGTTSASTDYTTQAKNYVADQLKAIGKTQDEYIQMLAQQLEVNKYEDKLTADIKVTDADLKNYYDTTLKAEKDGTSTDSSAVQLIEQPSVTVKHILIALPQADQDQYNTLVSQSKTDEAKTYLDEKLKTIYSKAESVLKLAQKGENFEKLINQYGEDPGMKDNPNGYVVTKDGGYVQEFTDEAFKLNVGQISGLVGTQFGYHIIKAYAKTPEKIYTLAEKKSEITQAVTSQKKDDKWNSIVEGWKKSSTIKTYENLL